MKGTISRATLGRLPEYLRYLRTLDSEGGASVSATAISRALSLGEVQVRKDLNSVSDGGRPRVGYLVSELIERLEECLGSKGKTNAIVIGAGRLGRALLEYGGFELYGIRIVAGFDSAETVVGKLASGKEILPMEKLEDFCEANEVKLAVLTVPAAAAQNVCDRVVDCGINGIWSFAPVDLAVPEGVYVQKENLALSLACVNQKLGLDMYGPDDDDDI